MTTEEAVRIVREEVIPGYASRRTVAALSTVLAALEQAQSEVSALRLACNVSAADLTEVGRICGMTDDEYPLKAVQRVVAALEEASRLKAGMDRCDLAQHRHHEQLIRERDEARAKVAWLTRVFRESEAGWVEPTKVLMAEVARLRDWQMVREREIDAGVTRIEARAKQAEAALGVERERSERLRWLGENWPAFWIVLPGWAQAEKYRAAIAALAPEVKP